MKPFAYMRDDGADGYEFCREGDDGAFPVYTAAQVNPMRQQLAEAKSALGGFCMAPLDGTVTTGIKALSMRCAAVERDLHGAKVKLSFGKQWPTSEDCLRLAEMLRDVPGGIGEAIDALEAVAAQKELSVKY